MSYFDDMANEKIRETITNEQVEGLLSISTFPLEEINKFRDCLSSIVGKYCSNNTYCSNNARNLAKEQLEVLSKLHPDFDPNLLIEFGNTMIQVAEKNPLISANTLIKKQLTDLHKISTSNIEFEKEYTDMMIPIAEKYLLANIRELVYIQLILISSKYTITNIIEYSKMMIKISKKHLLNNQLYQPINIISWSCNHVCHWLVSLAPTFISYKEIITDNGIDGLFLIKEMTENMLKELGIEKKVHRRKIIQGLETLKSTYQQLITTNKGIEKLDENDESNTSNGDGDGDANENDKSIISDVSSGDVSSDASGDASGDRDEKECTICKQAYTNIQYSMRVHIGCVNRLCNVCYLTIISSEKKKCPYCRYDLKNILNDQIKLNF